MENPIKSLIPKPEPGPGIAKEIGETARQATNENNMALHPPEAAPVKAAPIGAPAPMRRVQSPYGTGEGAKRGEMRPADFNKKYPDLPKMHSGGTVPKTGPYVLKAGEKVLTGDQHDKLHKAMGLAASALSHEDSPEPGAPPKVIRAMHIRKAADGTHVIEHHHMSPMHPMEEHTAGSTDELHDHIEQHWGEPNDGEMESENERDESPGVKAAEETVGLK